jgi:hypothetical protein
MRSAPGPAVHPDEPGLPRPLQGKGCASLWRVSKRERQASLETAVLHPNQFQVNDAWIAFQLNDVPIETIQDGSFHCIALMDAASCFILGNAFVATTAPAPSPTELRRLLKAGWEHKRQYPKTLFVPKGQFEAAVRAEATRHGIAVVPVPEDQLFTFIGEARQGFREFVHRGGGSEA